MNAITIPHEIDSFFDTVYGQEPKVEQVKKTTVYSVPEKGLSIITDPYGGCHVDVKQISEEKLSAVREAIGELSEAFRSSGAFDSVWIDIALPANPQTLGFIAPESFVIGNPGKSDLIYDYQQKKVRLWQWLNDKKECAIPAGATHNIGATALVIDNVAKKVLLVVNVHRDNAWNLPGGSFEPGIDNAPCFTALREAQEEGGFEVDKEAVSESRLIGQMQFPNNQFAPAINQIWAYFIDGISEKKLNPPADEIKIAEWVDFDKIIHSDGTLDDLKLSEEIKTPLIAAINGLGSREIVNKGWMIVHAPKV